MPKSKAPAQTFEEAEELRRLVEAQSQVRVKLLDGNEYEGTIEFWDQAFLRLTRASDEPNLFIFKHEIRYIAELEG